MKETLFDLTEEALQLEALLADEAGDVTGVEEQIDAYLADLNDRMSTKVDAYVGLINHFKKRFAIRKERAEAILALAKTDENNASRLKDRLYQAFKRLGKNRMETVEHKLWIQNNGGALPLIFRDEAINPYNIPDSLVNKSVSAEKIRDAIMNPEHPDHAFACTLAQIGERGDHLRIK